jgi:hypothetical protein
MNKGNTSGTQFKDGRFIQKNIISFSAAKFCFIIKFFLLFRKYGLPAVDFSIHCIRFRDKILLKRSIQLFFKWLIKVRNYEVKG